MTNASSCKKDDEDEGHSGRVLGPLSRNAGGTTGVVLDAESDSTSAGQEKVHKSYFSSVVNYVASALTPDEQRILDDKRKQEILCPFSENSANFAPTQRKIIIMAMCDTLG